MEMGKSKVLIEFLLIFRQFGDVLFFINARRLRGYTATLPLFVKGHSHGQSFSCLWKREVRNWIAVHTFSDICLCSIPPRDQHL